MTFKEFLTEGSFRAKVGQIVRIDSNSGLVAIYKNKKEVEGYIQDEVDAEFITDYEISGIRDVFRGGTYTYGDEDRGYVTFVKISG